jgi:hypothetical protein
LVVSFFKGAKFIGHFCIVWLFFLYITVYNYKYDKSNINIPL